MRGLGIQAAVLSVLWAALLAPTGRSEQEDRIRDLISIDQTAPLRPTPAMLAIWTDQPGYQRQRDLINVYLAVAQAGDHRRFRQFIYLEHMDTGRRQYLVQDGGDPRLRDEIVDVLGRPPRKRGGERITDLPPTKIWGGSLLEPGLWQFVAELRSLDTTEVLKSAHAKFVVSPTQPEVIGADSHDTEISSDTTWTNDTIYALRHQLFVNPGATLRIEPGTLILAKGPRAVIVVERGARIEARGRPNAPVVMTCDGPIGQREPGCWGGLVVLGRAPMARGTDFAEGIIPEHRPTYGGSDPLDASGVLEYVRVEFASSVGLGLYGVGAGTRIDHVQVHASAGVGFLFSGGSAGCTYCVASGTGGDGLAWAQGWQGSAQHVFVQMHSRGSGAAIAGDIDEPGFDALPRSAPVLYNLTLVGDLAQAPASRSHGPGIALNGSSAITARNVIVTGFPAGAISAGDNSLSLFADGTSSIGNAILHANDRASANGQISSGLEDLVGYQDADPMLTDVGYRANPDPRPLLDSPALRVGAGTVPRSDGFLDTSARYSGAFGRANWLTEWTFFGPESDYATR